MVPAKPRKSECGRLTHCTGSRNGFAARSSSTSTVSRYSSRCGPRIPGRAGAAARNIVAEARRERDRLDVPEAELGREARELAGDPLEHRPVEIDQIDLVHRQHDMADAEQAHDDGVAAGLRQQSLARIDQQHGQLGIGGAGRHVAGVLLVAGRVGDDEGAPRRGEIAVGDVDGDALLALGFQAVEQQREIDIGADGAVLLGIAGERGQMIVEDQVLLVEQPADQRRFAVVDRAAGEKRKAGGVGVRDGFAGRSTSITTLRSFPRKRESEPQPRTHSFRPGSRFRGDERNLAICTSQHARNSPRASSSPSSRIHRGR